jgi:myo-inositol-1(or 4)-monophosphatase
MRNTGCAALDLAYVGSGRLDGFFHNKINIWDIAAGILIIDEAGGEVSDISKFGDEDIDIRASNSNIYQKMLEKIKNF